MSRDKPLTLHRHCNPNTAPISDNNSNGSEVGVWDGWCVSMTKSMAGRILRTSEFWEVKGTGHERVTMFYKHRWKRQVGAWMVVKQEQSGTRGDLQLQPWLLRGWKHRFLPWPRDLVDVFCVALAWWWWVAEKLFFNQQYQLNCRFKFAVTARV